MNNQPTKRHQLIANYLDELSALLAGIDPAERAEVVEGVREHIDSALEGTDVTEADLRVALAEVGPAQAVADEAYAGRQQPAPPAARAPITSHVWLPVVTAALEGVAVLLVLMSAAVAASGVMTTSSSTSSSSSGQVSRSVAGGGPSVATATTVSESSFDGSRAVVGALGGFFVAFPFWLVLAILVGLSALWVGREKVALIAVVPACALAFAVLPELCYLAFGINGAYTGAWLALAVCVLGGGALVGVLVRRACRRAGALSST